MRAIAHVINSCSLLGCAALALACGSDPEPTSEPQRQVTPAPLGEAWDTLDEWGLFETVASQEPSARVVPVAPISPLFSDYTTKRRFVWLPEGTQIGWSDTDIWDFPTGTILAKTFSYLTDARDPSQGERLLETRLLVKAEDGFRAHTYIYDQSGESAERKVAGKTIPVSFTDPSGRQLQTNYEVPNTNLCQDCHGEAPALNSLAGRTRQLDRELDYGDGPENQIDHLAALGMLDREPPAERQQLVDPFGEADLSLRTRSYFDSNCASCHKPGGNADSSGLYLNFENTDPDTGNPTHWGVCKVPTSAGGATCERRFDVVPGKPEESILTCRVASEDPQVRMPPVASSIAHVEGVALLEQWVAALPAQDCSR